jgi:hypothetical protein
LKGAGVTVISPVLKPPVNDRRLVGGNGAEAHAEEEVNAMTCLTEANTREGKKAISWGMIPNDVGTEFVKERGNRELRETRVGVGVDLEQHNNGRVNTGGVAVPVNMVRDGRHANGIGHGGGTQEMGSACGERSCQDGRARGVTRGKWR